MAKHPIARQVFLDSTGTDGAVSEVSKVVALDDRQNAVQLQMRTPVLTATAVACQLEVSFDEYNFEDFGSSQDVTVIGRKNMTKDTAIAAPFVRYTFSITGTGKAVFDADLNVSEQ